MSLRRRLFVPVLAALLPIVGIEAYNQYELRVARQQEIRQSAVDQARRVAAEQQRIIDGVQDVLSTLAILAPVRDHDGPACDQLLATVLPHYQGFEALVATDAAGVPFCMADVHGTPSAAMLPSVGEAAFFRDTMEHGQFTVGGYAIDHPSATHVLRLALPIPNRSGRPDGVLYVDYDLQSLAARLSGSQWNASQSFAVTDRNGVLLVRQPNTIRYVGRVAPPEIWDRVQAAKGPFVFKLPSDWDGIERIVGVIPPAVGPGGLGVAVGLSYEGAFAALDAATWRGALVIALGALVSLWLAWLIGLRLVHSPIVGLVKATQRWRNGDFTARSNLSGSSEFGQLGAAFDAMAEELDRALKFKDVLLRELRHRVMNSLQIISSLFNLQARSLRDPEARAQFIEAAGRITSMALAYRRMHSAEGVEVIEFAEYLRELCAAIGSSLMQQWHGCQVDADSVLLGPEQASPLALIVNELVTNAVKHGGTDAPVGVALERSSNECRLSVRNAGRLPEGFNLQHNPGFGMQMVTMLVGQLNGQIDFSSENGETVFTVSFIPAVPQVPQLAVVDDQPTVVSASG